MLVKSLLLAVGRLLKESVNGFIKHDGTRMSAALAYYSAFSLAPLLLIAVAITGAFFGDDAVRGVLGGELRRTMGPSAAFVVQDMVANARKPADTWMMSIFGITLLLVGAAGVFGELQAALNKIWDTGEKPNRGFKGIVRDRLMSFSMVLVTGFLLLASMVLSTVLQAMAAHLGESTGLPLAAWITSSGILSFLVTVLLFSAIFKILPDAPIQWRDVWVGALFTTFLFIIGKYAIGWYLSRAATTSSYGSAGSFVVMLLWLYYSSMILLFGAEFTEAHKRLRDVRPSDR